jgi:hypothetical protein
MKFAIDPNYDPTLMDRKIDNIRADRRLSANMNSIPAPKLAQFHPKLTFSIGH